jgi:CDP-glucose 4,6-dehydratase
MAFRRGALGQSVRLMIDKAFWQGKRVLLTGHTGFKGVWLGLWLKRLGAQVFGVSLPPESDLSLFNLVPQNADGSILGDIRDRAVLRKAAEQADPEIVIHMAAQAFVRRSYREPCETFDINVQGTVNLLDALRERKNLAAVLVITTDKVYRNLEDGRAFREDDPLGGHDPYSASKAAAEIAAQSMAQSFFAPAGIPVITARAGNVIGGGDWSQDRLVPDIWRAIRAGKELVLRYPAAIRPWQHVVEPLAGYLGFVQAAATGNKLPAALNFGPYKDDTLTVSALAEAMLSALGASAAWRQDQRAQPPEMALLALDPALAERVIGWVPRLSSSQTIAWTAEWYGRFFKGADARALCLEQIARYEDLK